MTDTVRSFVAVPLPETIRTDIFAAAQELARALPQSGIKWFRKIENLHITVKFSGRSRRRS
jgi:2'-5' RNA ligase